MIAPRSNHSRVVGLNHIDYNFLYKTIENETPRSCIIVRRSITDFLLSPYRDAGTTAIKIKCDKKAIVLVSSYMSHDHDIGHMISTNSR